MDNKEEIVEVRYLTDDRDTKNRMELVISRGGNGDWYVSVTPEGSCAVRGVRLCTSGGASSAVPGLCPSIARAFESIVKVKGRGITHLIEAEGGGLVVRK